MKHLIRICVLILFVTPTFASDAFSARRCARLEKQLKNADCAAADTTTTTSPGPYTTFTTCPTPFLVTRLEHPDDISVRKSIIDAYWAMEGSCSGYTLHGESAPGLPEVIHMDGVCTGPIGLNITNLPDGGKTAFISGTLQCTCCQGGLPLYHGQRFE
jgi:hypothetical protein